jgi:GAF domain-containing protein
MRVWGTAHQLLLKLVAVVKPNSQTMEDAEADLRAIIRTFLDSAVQVFGDKRCGGAVLWPVEGGKYLAYWGEVNMQAHGDWRFEIGSPDKEGVAGYSFKTGRMARGIMVREGDKWRCTDPHYRFKEDNSREPRYRSFICIPLVGPEVNTLGIVSFDSPRADTFNSPEVLKVIVEMADSLAAALVAYQNSLESMQEIIRLRSMVSALDSGEAVGSTGRSGHKN